MGDPLVGNAGHERMGVKEVVDPEGHDLRATVSVPVLVEVRSVVDRSSSVARLDTAPFPLVLLYFTTDVPSMKEARATQLPQNGKRSTKGYTVFPAVGNDKGRFFLGESRC